MTETFLLWTPGPKFLNQFPEAVMKIKIPFTNKQVVLDPVFEGLLVMISIYTFFATMIILYTTLGAKLFYIAVASFFVTGLIKTSKIENVGDDNVKEDEE